jgi:hypothetical protein
LGKLPIPKSDIYNKKKTTPMNISAVSPTTKRHEDFNTLQSALQSGNISNAQSAFAAFLQDVQKTAQTAGPSSIFSPGTQASKDLQALGNALKSANLNGAQKAFATLQQDIQSAGQSPATLPFSQGHHALTPSEIANNGAETFQAGAQGSPVAQAIGNILNMKA